MTLFDLLIPTYSNTLTALRAWLDKAPAPSGSVDGVLSDRLAPDMFPLASQIRFCCIQAYEGVARLRGEAMPAVWSELVSEGRGANEDPGRLTDAKARVEDAIAFLAGLEPDALAGGAEREIVIELPNDLTFVMNGEEYARDWALPQFYFHAVTAYAILRSQGAELGKADYVPHAAAYLRAGALPKS